MDNKIMRFYAQNYGTPPGIKSMQRTVPHSTDRRTTPPKSRHQTKTDTEPDLFARQSTVTVSVHLAKDLLERFLFKGILCDAFVQFFCRSLQSIRQLKEEKKKRTNMNSWLLSMRTDIFWSSAIKEEEDLKKLCERDSFSVT